MAKFKIATPAGASFTVKGGGYDYEMEALQGMDAEIVEGPTDEDGFIKFTHPQPLKFLGRRRRAQRPRLLRPLSAGAGRGA